MKNLPKNSDPYLIRQQNLDHFKEDLINRTKKYNETALGEDMDLINMINNDISTVINTCPEGDIYASEKPVIQVVRDNGSIRVYGLEVSGGIALIYKKGSSSYSGLDTLNILTLGEDDGWYFPKCRRLYEPLFAEEKYNASTIINLLSQVLALFNSIEK